MCLSHLICTVRPFLIHTCHAMPCPCHAPTMPFFSRPQHGRLSTVVLCCGLEKNGMVGAWHGHGMASVNQTRPHCANQMGKTHSKPLAARHDRGTAWAWHAMCESAFAHHRAGCDHLVLLLTAGRHRGGPTCQHFTCCGSSLFCVD